ncbi:sel1 repeat family protein [Paraburkholderia sp. Se-20369]|nr:sel1 repeat family protein [Paraburkholderia sp. Se-20369]
MNLRENKVEADQRRDGVEQGTRRCRASGKRMGILNVRRMAFAYMVALATGAQADVSTSLVSRLTAATSSLPRHEKLPVFNPHRKDFTCVYQDEHVPPVDAQAELWFQQALTLDDPDVYYKRRDYPQIYRLYQQAAERGHWKAMLNLASLTLSR